MTSTAPNGSESELLYDPSLKYELQTLKGRDGQYVISTMSDIYVLIDFILQREQAAAKAADRAGRLSELEDLIPEPVVEMASIDARDELERIFDYIRSRIATLTQQDTNKRKGAGME